MAILSDVTLSVEKISTSPNYVKVTIKYRLTPSRVEQMARTVFSEAFSLLGRDWPVLPAATGLESSGDMISVPTHDTTIITIAGSLFAVSPTTSHVDRSRSFTLSKSRLNEDPETTATGSEVADELIAQAKVAYAANAPMPASALVPAFSSLLTGIWV